MATTIKTLLTIADYEALPPAPDRRRELSDGELIEMTFPRGRHQRAAKRLMVALENFVEPRGLGEVFTMDSGFILGPGTLRGPDAAFVCKERLASYDPDGYFDGGPDLVVEVVSPHDTAADLHRRLEQFFAAGTQVAWIVYPDQREVEVREPGKPTRTLRATDVLSAPDLVPGFELSVSDLF